MRLSPITTCVWQYATTAFYLQEISGIVDGERRIWAESPTDSCSRISVVSVSACPTVISLLWQLNSGLMGCSNLDKACQQRPRDEPGARERARAQAASVLVKR